MGHISNIVAQQKPSELYFLFSSPGGEVAAGITFYHFLKSLPVKIVMHNTGSIDSIATVIFMAGIERYAARCSSFLFHGVACGFPTNTQFRLPALREVVSSLLQDQNKISGIISSNCKLTKRQIGALFDCGDSKDTAYALKMGIIHDILDPNIPRDADFVTLTFPNLTDK